MEKKLADCIPDNVIMVSEFKTLQETFFNESDTL